jgi:hypothetical protein
VTPDKPACHIASKAIDFVIFGAAIKPVSIRFKGRMEALGRPHWGIAVPSWAISAQVTSFATRTESDSTGVRALWSASPPMISSHLRLTAESKREIYTAHV